jgi:hypothetical protein
LAAGEIHRFVIVGVAQADDGDWRPCQATYVVDADGAWTSEHRWLDAGQLQTIHGDQPEVAHYIRRLMARPTDRVPTPAGRE